MTNYPPAFEAALGIMLKLEGVGVDPKNPTGFSNNPADPGGATAFGISLQVVKLRDFDKDHSLDFDLDKDGDVDEADIHALSFENMNAVKAFYYQDYWLPTLAFPEAFSNTNVILFDCAVNQGVRTAVELLKEAGKYNDIPMFLLYRRMILYSGYKNAATFIKGWGNRLEGLRKALGL